MKTGDLMYCTFGSTDPVLCTLISEVQRKYWNILWHGRVILMHEQHLEAVCK
jgi:hypothetical protein